MLLIAHKPAVLLILAKTEDARRNVSALIIGAISIRICVQVLAKIMVEISIFRITQLLEIYAFEFAHILTFMVMLLPIPYNLIATRFALTTTTATTFPPVIALPNAAKIQ